MEKSSLFYFHRLKASHKNSLNLGVFVYLFDKVCKFYFTKYQAIQDLHLQVLADLL